MKPVILITGASSGFGDAIAHTFAAADWDLIVTARRAERLAELKTKLEKEYNCQVLTLCFDVREEAQVNEQFEQLPADWKNRLKILINNAGLAVGRGPIEDAVTDDWNRMIDTNIKGLLYVSKAVIPMLKANKSGHIVNIASIAGKEAYAGGNVYCATKHAVDALSRSMRIDLVHDNIKVTNIAPGAAETEFSLVRFKGDEQTAKNVYDGFEPLVAQDIADTVYFVCTRPAHVCINDLVIMPTAQASATVFHKD